MGKAAYGVFQNTLNDTAAIAAAANAGNYQVNIKAYAGAAGDGVSDDYSSLKAAFDYCNANGLTWFLPTGTYLCDGDGTLDIQTSGMSYGVIEIPKDNQDCRVVIKRDSAGSSVSTSGWSGMTRGATNIGATNAAGKNLYIASTDVIIEKVGGGALLKQEFIRATANTTGLLSTPLVHTYGTIGNVTVTGYTPSTPVLIVGLSVLRSGSGTPAAQGTIDVQRDSAVLLNASVDNDTPASPLKFGITVGYCADVLLLSPKVSGCQYAGLGYGIMATATIGLTIENAVVTDCRHGLSGAYNVDLHVVGGQWADGLDDHWGDRMSVDNARIYVPDGSAAVQFAGRDFHASDCTAIGGRSFFGIRIDTPWCGGVVRINNTKVIGRQATSTYWLFGFTSLSGTGAISETFTNKPELPDVLSIGGAAFDVSTDIVAVVWLGLFQKAHKAVGQVVVNGAIDFGGKPGFGVYLEKNTSYSEDRSPSITVDTPSSFNANGTAVYIYASDSVRTRGCDVFVRGTSYALLRFSSFGVNSLACVDAQIATVTNDDDTEAFASPQSFVFQSCRMLGGAVGTFERIAFIGCVFTGAYSSFPAANATMLGNTSTVAQTTLPADIRATLVAPFV